MEKQISLWGVIKVVLLCLIPPVGVWIKVGIKDKHFWINLVLTLIGYLPGLVHGVWVYVNKKDEDIIN